MEKSVTEFYRSSGRYKDGLHPWCKECTRSYNREYVKKNPEDNRRRANRARVKQKYGISWQEREQKILDQEGRCAICCKEFASDRDTHLDHCHETQKIRDMLCAQCNVGLGSFRDSPELLLHAAAYIERHRERM